MSRADTAPQTWNVVTTARATAQKTLSRAETRAPTPKKEMRELTPAVNARCSAASTERVGAIVACSPGLEGPGGVRNRVRHVMWNNLQP